MTHYFWTTDAVEDDLALEVVVLLGTVAGDQSAAQLIVNTGILHALVNLLNGTFESMDLDNSSGSTSLKVSK